MPEISARDLKRLQALESRLEKATDERRELRAAINANQRRARAAEKAVETTEERLAAVIAENTQLASSLEQATGDLEQVQAASLSLRKELDAAREELGVARTQAGEARAAAAAAEKAREAVTESLELAQAQLAGEGIEPALPAKAVADLLDDLVGELGGSLHGLAVSEGELRLNVAFGKVGSRVAFVVPSADSTPELRDSTHDVTLRFDRGVLEP